VGSVGSILRSAETSLVTMPHSLLYCGRRVSCLAQPGAERGARLLVVVAVLDVVPTQRLHLPCVVLPLELVAQGG